MPSEAVAVAAWMMWPEMPPVWTRHWRRDGVKEYPTECLECGGAGERTVADGGPNEFGVYETVDIFCPSCEGRGVIYPQQQQGAST